MKEMFVRNAVKVFFLVFCVGIFGSCGELDIGLPGEETYRIKTLVNEISLEECALIRAGDVIRPWCEDSVTDDPDVCGLSVSFENSRKETVGGKIRYVLKDRAGFDFPDGKTAESPVVQSTAAEDTQNSEYLSAAPVSGESDASDENNPGAESSPENAAEAPAGNPPETAADTLITVDGLGINLPSFQLPADTAIGHYTLIFRVLGEREILGEIKQNFYYLGESAFSLSDIQMYLPGVFSKSQLVPPETTVLLEAAVESDPRFSPYIIWYNGKKIIREGSLSDGSGLVFWKAPEQTGFQTLRAEIFPSSNHAGMKGLTREIVLPVSAKAPRAEFFSVPAPADIVWLATQNSGDADNATVNPPELKHWYQFAGNLDDSAGSRQGNPLAPSADTQPRWNPMGYSYGLSAGPSAAYRLAPASFASNDNGGRGGAFLFRVKPVSDGVLMSVLFESQDQGVTVELLLAGDKLVLQSGSGETLSEEMIIPVDTSGTASYISAALVFYLYENQLEARLVPENNPAGGIEFVIKTPEPLSGQCSVSLGSSAGPQSAESGQTPNFNPQDIPPTAIWNQLAVLSVTPPAPAEVEGAGNGTQAETAGDDSGRQESSPGAAAETAGEPFNGTQGEAAAEISGIEQDSSPESRSLFAGTAN